MPTEEFAKGFPLDGNNEPIIGHYRSVFDEPSIMTINVDIKNAIVALPIDSTHLEAFTGIYQDYLSRH